MYFLSLSMPNGKGWEKPSPIYLVMAFFLFFFFYLGLLFEKFFMYYKFGTALVLMESGMRDPPHEVEAGPTCQLGVVL